jgi:Tfp pilus assembly protein PilE
MNRKKRAFTLADLILVVLFIGIFAAIAVPRIDFSVISRQKADALARKIVTDLRRTRMLAISDAANNEVGFELKFVAPPPYSAYEIENMKTNVKVDSHTLDPGVSVSCLSSIRFMYGPLGNLEIGSGSGIIISAEGKSFTINFIPATGTVKCVEN